MVPGLGVDGLWIGIIFGFLHQICAYSLLILTADWDKISKLAL